MARSLLRVKLHHNHTYNTPSELAPKAMDHLYTQTSEMTLCWLRHYTQQGNKLLIFRHGILCHREVIF